MSISQFDERTILVTLTKFVLADGTGLKTLFTGTTAGSRLDDILLTNDGALAHDVEFVIGSPSVDHLVGSVSVPAGTGKLGTPPVYLSATILPPNQLGWPLMFSQTFKARLVVAMGVAETLDIIGIGGSL